MQHFDNLDCYTEEDFDYILYQPSSKKPYLDPELKQFYFAYRDWETDRKSTRLNSSHITRSRMPSSA